MNLPEEIFLALSGRVTFANMMSLWTRTTRGAAGDISLRATGICIRGLASGQHDYDLAVIGGGPGGYVAGENHCKGL